MKRVEAKHKYTWHTMRHNEILKLPGERERRREREREGGRERKKKKEGSRDCKEFREDIYFLFLSQHIFIKTIQS